jgi:hypothetical protein
LKCQAAKLMENITEKIEDLFVCASCISLEMMN